MATKFFFYLSFFLMTFEKLHLHHFPKIKSHKEVPKQQDSDPDPTPDPVPDPHPQHWQVQ
jgi:hypothetical protein